MKRRAFSLAAQVSVLSIVPTLFWGLWWEPASLTVEQIPLELPRLTAPLRVAALGDLHVGSPNVGLSRLREIVARVNAEAPDLVLFTGDFMVGTPDNPDGMLGSHFIAPNKIAAELEHLRAPYGVYAVLGNHDWWSDGEALTEALQRAGIRVLENQAVAVETPEQRVWLGGIADLWTRTPDIAGTLRQVEERLARRGDIGGPRHPVHPQSGHLRRRSRAGGSAGGGTHAWRPG